LVTFYSFGIKTFLFLKPVSFLWLQGRDQTPKGVLSLIPFLLPLDLGLESSRPVLIPLKIICAKRKPVGRPLHERDPNRTALQLWSNCRSTSKRYVFQRETGGKSAQNYPIRGQSNFCKWRKVRTIFRLALTKTVILAEEQTPQFFSNVDFKWLNRPKAAIQRLSPRASNISQFGSCIRWSTVAPPGFLSSSFPITSARTDLAFPAFYIIKPPEVPERSLNRSCGQPDAAAVKLTDTQLL
jgi:hypothetical protein